MQPSRDADPQAAPNSGPAAGADVPRAMPHPGLASMRGSSMSASMKIVEARRQRALMMRDAASSETPFSLQAPSVHIPSTVWERHGTQLDAESTEPALKRTKSIEEAVKAKGGQCCSKLLSVLHAPYFPWWGKLHENREHLFGDMMAGLTAGVMLIPQGMAYMMVASLPPITGLYTGSISPFFFALLGTSKQLSVGPAVLPCIYFPTVLQELGVLAMTFPSKQERDIFLMQVASLVAFFVGVTFLLMGTLRLGLLIRYLSHSVMTGFTSAAGLYVAISQLKYILDIHPKHARYHILEYRSFIEHVPHSNHKTIILGSLSFIVMFTCKMLKRKYPPTTERKKHLGYRVFKVLATFSTLIVVMVTAVIASTLDIPIVGTVKAGLSHYEMPAFTNYSINAVFQESVPVALLGFMEAYAVGRKYAELYHYEIDSNQDLFALGVCNVVGSFFQNFVSSGSFSRTALNAEAGARTTFANLMTGSFMILTLTTLSPYLYYIPMAVLGAVIECAIISLVDFTEFVRAFRIAPLNFVVMVITFLATFLISIQDGLMYGVVSSVAIVMFQLSSVDTVELGLDGDAPVGRLRFITVHEMASAMPPDPRVEVVRPLAALFFGNALSFRSAFQEILRAGMPPGGSVLRTSSTSSSLPLEEDMKEMEEGKDVARFEYVIVDGCAIKILDLTAMGALAEVADEAATLGVTVIFSNCSPRLCKALEDCGLYEGLGGALVSKSVECVYRTVLDWLRDDDDVSSVPLLHKPSH